MKQHLVIIIDNKKIVDPKKYSCPIGDKTKEEAIKSSKLTYEKNHKNFDYESYYFVHEI
jgi:hypothetical protein